MIRSGGSLGALIRNTDSELERQAILKPVSSGRYVKNVSQTIEKNTLNLNKM